MLARASTTAALRLKGRWSPVRKKHLCGSTILCIKRAILPRQAPRDEHSLGKVEKTEAFLVCFLLQARLAMRRWILSSSQSGTSMALAWTTARCRSAAPRRAQTTRLSSTDGFRRRGVRLTTAAWRCRYGRGASGSQGRGRRGLDTSGAAVLIWYVKTRLFEPFVYKCDRFARTGSGQS